MRMHVEGIGEQPQVVASQIVVDSSRHVLPVSHIATRCLAAGGQSPEVFHPSHTSETMPPAIPVLLIELIEPTRHNAGRFLPPRKNHSHSSPSYSRHGQGLLVLIEGVVQPAGPMARSCLSSRNKRSPCEGRFRSRAASACGIQPRAALVAASSHRPWWCIPRRSFLAATGAFSKSSWYFPHLWSEF